MYSNQFQLPALHQKGVSFARLLLYVVLFNLTAALNAKAQSPHPDTLGHKILFETFAAGKKHMITDQMFYEVSDTAVYQIFNKLKPAAKDYAAVVTPKSPILLGVKLNPSLSTYYSAAVQSISKHYQTFVIADSSAAELIAMGINTSNIKNYKYRVVENDSAELIPWQPIPKLEQKYGAKQPYGFIGKYCKPGKRIMVEVADVNNYGIRDGVIFDWRKGFKPIIEEIQVSTPSTYFNLAYKALNKGYATRFDHNGLPLDFKFPQDSVSTIVLKLKKQETLVQKVYLLSSVNGKNDTLWLAYVDQHGYCQINSSNFTKPGHYQIIVKKQEKYNVWDDAQMLRIKFEVVEANLSDKTFSLKQLLPYLAGLIILFIAGVLALRFYNKQKLKKAHQQQAAAQLKLKSIRSQLNPHFMFNALSSVQNLMNKNEVMQANHYLAKFAGLTRTVLNTSEKDMISLEEELKIAADYLQMEQLRFGFNFNVKIDDALDIANIDVPAMLLQPFIENAVKHGIALLRENGNIYVKALRNGNNLLLVVADNGKGFDTQAATTTTGFGLKISNEQIMLINQLYGAGSAVLNIELQPGNTTINITLNNWI